eukprot:1166734-Prymnesium_polylepis.1
MHAPQPNRGSNARTRLWAPHMPEPNQTLRGAAARIAPTAPGALNSSDMPGVMYQRPEIFGLYQPPRVARCPGRCVK